MRRRLLVLLATFGVGVVALLMTSDSALAVGSTVTMRAGDFDVQGLTLLNDESRDLFHAVAGPREGVAGFMGKGLSGTMRGRLSTPIADQGGLQFWFRANRDYRSGKDGAEVTQKLVEIVDTLVVSFQAQKNAITLLVEWGGPKAEMFPRHVRIILPEFPGTEWHHLAISFDGAAGDINAFLDGTPYYVPGEKVPPLTTLRGTELVLYASAFALAEVRVAATPINEGELRASVGAAQWGKLDGLLGATDLGRLTEPDHRGATLYERKLSSAADLAGWVLEGPGTVSFHDGWMTMKSERPAGPEGHVVHWCPVVFPDRFQAEFDFELLDDKGLCILFFAASGQGGRGLFDLSLRPRTGVFSQYTEGDIDCYHISYFANTPNEPRRVANLRKNSGFYLIANGPVGVPHPKKGQVHHAVLMKDHAHIRMAVDGIVIIDYRDDGKRAGPVLGEGKIGFRQMQWTSARYRNFQVFELK